MAILTRETKFAVSKGPQTNISTIAAEANLLSFRKLNFAPINPGLVAESDAGWIGAGNEFATQIYNSHWAQQWEIEAYLTSQWLAWASAMCLGSSVKSLTGPWLYTSVPQVPLTDGIEPPYATVVQQIRDIDEGYIGGIVNSFRVVAGKGPGLENSKIFIGMIGSGIINTATGYTLPAVSNGDFLTQGSMAVTILTTNYVATKRIETLEWGFNLDAPPDQGYYPGSGSQDGAAVQGRIEFRNRIPILNFTVRVEAAADELTKMIDGTTGTAAITQGSGDHTYTATFHKVGFEAVERADSDGILVVNVTGRPMWHTSNGLLTVAAKTDIDAIGE
jgi:hypothetical protein